MKANKDKRVVYWNRRAEEAPLEIHTWYFLVVNEPKMIGRIKQRLFEQLMPVDNRTEYANEVITGQGLRVNCFSFETPKTNFERSEVYNGIWKKDNELYRREGLDNLVDRRIKALSK